jgi:Rho GDP-dissociation inhibitor
MADAPAPDAPPLTSRRSSGGSVAADDYVAPEAKSVNELMEAKDGEDEALQRYKAQLLAGAASAKTDDPRRVVIVEMSVLFPDRDPIVIDMTDEAAVAKGVTFVFKEGASYKMQHKFRVQNEIVSGLKYRNVVKRGPVQVMKTEEMLGSYGPNAEPNTIQVPRREWDEVPSGMMARGTYSATVTFSDDDKAEHLTFTYRFEIKKGWE